MKMEDRKSKIEERKNLNAEACLRQAGTESAEKKKTEDGN